MNKDKKLKPVIFVATRCNVRRKNVDNVFQQNMLLNAMTVTHDPKKLKEMIGVRTVAEVYRTLDKLSLRKDYHKALAQAGIDFNFIVKGIKDVAINAFKDADKLSAYKTLLKSVGMDSYDESTSGGGSWEDTLINAIEKDKDDKKLTTGSIETSFVVKENSVEEEIPDYEVNAPIMPDSVVKQISDEKDFNHAIYG